MKYKIVICAILLPLCSLLHAQTIDEAEDFFNEGKYEQAYKTYKQLLSRRNDARTKALISYKAGRSLVAAEKWTDDAVSLFKVSLERRYYKSHFYLGMIYFHQYRFVESEESFGLYKELRGEKLPEIEQKELDSCILQAQLGVSMLQRVEDIAIADSVKFHKNDFFTAYRLTADLGKIGLFRELVNDGRERDKSDASVFMTGRNDRMIFAENDADNYDLNISYRLIDGWSERVKLSKNLNTDKDENYPFVLPDGITIYFASKGHNSLGGYDIFFSRYNGAMQDYTQPQNIGMPFNSPANDYMLVIDEMSKVAWFATDRGQHKDTVVVYEFIPNAERTLLVNCDYDMLRDYASLKKYKKAVYNSKTLNTSDAITDNVANDTEINFVVNDTLIYTRLDQFKSKAARDLYLKFAEIDKKIATNTRIIDGKRREYVVTKSKPEQQQIYLEILSAEDNVFKYTDMLDEYIYKIRRSEMEALTAK